MDTFIFTIHIISCLILIFVILIQGGKGADLGAAFGGGSNTVFGSQGPATFLNKLTIIVAVIFLTASIYLAHAAQSFSEKSVVDQKSIVEKAEKINAESAEVEAGLKKDTQSETEKLKGEEKALKIEEDRQKQKDK